MPKFINCNHRDKVIRAIARGGFLISQGANHVIVHRADGSFVSTIPRHPRIKPGTLRAIIKQCGLTEDQFFRLYAGKKL